MQIINRIKNFMEDRGHPAFVRLLRNSVCAYNALHRGQIDRIRAAAERKPLILAVETVNICNAQCVFCVYPTMLREKKVMAMDIFEKTIREYAGMGGGALSLTPVMGDPLADPDFVARYKILEGFKNINQISFTTNGIAFKRFSDDELKYILEKTFLIQFSIGGLDRQEYQNLYKVDRLGDVLSSVDRVLRIKTKVHGAAHIVLAFRTNNPSFENDHAVQLNQFKQKGAMVSHISVYNNYGGMVRTQEVKLKRVGGISRRLPCAVPLAGPHVLSNGKVTNCGCVDADGDGLVIGDMHQDTVRGLWDGERRKHLLDSFSQGRCPKLCRDCSAYRPFSYFGSGIFRAVGFQRPLPIEFYVNFYGG